MNEATAQNTKTALHQNHIDAGAKMVPFAGFEMPVSYAGLVQEHHAVRQSCGMFDVSHMGEFLLSGPNALALIQKVSSNDASTLTIGRAQYSCLPNNDGGIVDDLIIYKMKEEQYLLVVNASNIDKDWDWISSQNDLGVEMKNLSDDLIDLLEANYKIQALELVLKHTSQDGTLKCLYSLHDGHLIESVLIKQHYGNSICVTTQVGCNIGCSFCASGQLKKKRDLTLLR